jgi:LPXTG-motif cell wall-anchored protein
MTTVSSLTGQSGGERSAMGQLVTGDTGLLLVVGGIVLLGALLFFWLRDRRPPS